MSITSNNKMTDNSDELSYNDLFVQSMQLQIPVFQREYRWGNREFKRMMEEINSIIEGKDDTRFLGAIIAVKRSSNPSKPQSFEIVDGQQRLTTLYLIILGSAYVLAINTYIEDANGIINKYIYNDWYEKGVNTKLLPSFKDRNQFKAVLNKVIQVGDLRDRFQYRIKLPDGSGAQTGKLTSQFEEIRKFLIKEFKEGGYDRINEIVNIAISKLTFIFILLKDASNATTVFHGLNDPGQPIGIGDLVRNEVFSYIYDNPDLASSVYSETWEPFHRKLGDFYDKFFFPYGIIFEPSIKNSDLFRGLRKIWGNVNNPSEIINQLEEYTQPFLALCTDNIPLFYDAQIKASLIKLRQSNSPTSIYPFVMKLLKEYERETIDSSETNKILIIIESFLVRRAICGIEPTGLLSLFRFLWNNLGGDISASKIKEVILTRTTIDWPDDDRLKLSVLNRKIYGSTICKYIILEYDRSLGADFPEGHDPWIEHVLPQTLNEEWKQSITEEDHKLYANTWGNLIPLSSKMNRELSQSRYLIKKPTIQSDSMYASARRLAIENNNWSKEQIINRSTSIANWALLRWPK